MFIAHLPAAVIVNHAYQRLRLQQHLGPASTAVLAIGALGSVAPDLDLVFFYTLDQRQHFHRGYLTHQPYFWLVVCCAFLVIAALLRRRQAGQAGLLFGINVLVHLCLDTVSGGILWLAPWSKHYFNLIQIPARFHPYLLNWVLHWSFAFELVICGAAVWILWQRRKKQRVETTMARVVWWLPQQE